MIFPSRSIFLPPLFRFYITTRFDSPRLRFLLSWEDVIIDPFAILFAPDFHERGEKERREFFIRSSKVGSIRCRQKSGAKRGSGRRVGRGLPLWHPWSPPYYHSLFVLTQGPLGRTPVKFAAEERSPSVLERCPLASPP